MGTRLERFAFGLRAVVLCPAAMRPVPIRWRASHGHGPQLQMNRCPCAIRRKSALGLAALLHLAVGASARGDAEALARFESEYPAASKRMEDRFRQVKGSCSLSIVSSSASKPAHSDEATFALDHGHELITIRRAMGNGVSAEVIYCVGPDTAFNLTRAPQAKTYVVEGIGSTALDRSSYVTLFGRFVKAHFASFGQPMARLVSDLGFRAVDAQYVDAAGQTAGSNKSSLVKVDFESGARGPKTRISCVFDPNAGWNILSSDFRIDAPSHVRVTTNVEYKAVRDGVALPSRVVCRDANGQSICEFRDWSFESTPLETFQMTHYGLPNLDRKAGSTSSPVAFWLVGAGAIVFTLALVMRRYASHVRPLPAQR